MNIMFICYAIMGSFWSFFSPILSGTITALVWVFLIWIYTSHRDYKLEKEIRITTSKIAISMGIDGIGIVIENNTHVPIVVRRVQMLLVATSDHRELEVGAPAGSLLLNYMGPTEIGSKSKTLENQGDIRNFIKLPPYTTGKWGIKPEWVLRHRGLYASTKFIGCKITIEYSSLLKKPKKIEIELTNGKDLGVSELFNEKLTAIRNQCEL